MTNESIDKAIDVLTDSYKLCPEGCDQMCSDCVNKAYEVAILALKRMKKAILVYGGSLEDFCPTCGTYLRYNNDLVYVLCPECGQKIDWSKEDDERRGNK